MSSSPNPGPPTSPSTRLTSSPSSPTSNDPISRWPWPQRLAESVPLNLGHRAIWEGEDPPEPPVVAGSLGALHSRNPFVTGLTLRSSQDPPRFSEPPPCAARKDP